MQLAEAHTFYPEVFPLGTQEGKFFSSALEKCSDYYPFGLTMPGRSSNSANPNDKYKFTGHERDDEAGINLDYMGARYADPVLGGRFLSIDPLASKYPSLSPYAYVANNPINAIDPDGRLIVYVNGFRTDAYKFYTASRMPQSPYRGMSAPWDHSQRIYNNDVFNYWGSFSNSFSSRIGDNHQLFVDGMYRPHSTGGDRYSRGYKDGQRLAEQILSGKVDLNGETIKLVGHSHGGAHAAGMAEALLEAGLPVESVFLFAPHQPGQFGVHYGVGSSYQFSRTGDHVSSDQSKLGIGQIFVGGSEFSGVSGISRLIRMQNGNSENIRI